MFFFFVSIVLKQYNHILIQKFQIHPLYSSKWNLFPPWVHSTQLQFYYQCLLRASLGAACCTDSCDPMDCSLPGFSVHGDSPGKNIEVGCHAPLQGFFPTEGSNPGFLHCWQNLAVWATREVCGYWNGWPIPSPVDLPDPGIELGSPALQVDSLPPELSGKPPLGLIGDLIPFPSDLFSLFCFQLLVFALTLSQQSIIWLTFLPETVQR